MKSTQIGAALVALGCAALVACTLRSSAPGKPSALTPAEQGKSLYTSYCAQCHGADARGDGPRAASLARAPADLTRIAQRSDGVFRADAVAAHIDGRSSVEAHGPREMPVWGRVMDDRNQALDQELKLTPAWIADIVAYLATLQR